ncbi:MAG: glutamate 5-kinase [Thiohalomonadales bacterium]
MTTAREQLAHCQRCVIKVGSSLLTANGAGLDVVQIATWVEQISVLQRRGVQVILVSSGAVAEGMQRLGWQSRPQTVHQLQAAAAVGQMGLIQNYESEFTKHGIHTAQILLTHDDLSNRKRYLNARSTLRTLLELGVVPVINENDTVTTEEIQFGDNDSLAALAVNLIEAQALILLTDQQGLYPCDPRTDASAKIIHEALASDENLDAMVQGAGALGRGGMLTKLRAARLAARSGAITAIAHGGESNIITRLLQGELIGSLLVPDQEPVRARKQWLASHLQPRGSLVLDAGAVDVLIHSGRSLLSVGVTAVQGDFQRGELVICVDISGKEIARGLVNYSAAEARQLLGQPSEKIESILGYVDDAELIHRDNMVLR